MNMEIESYVENKNEALVSNSFPLRQLTCYTTRIGSMLTSKTYNSHHLKKMDGESDNFTENHSHSFSTERNLSLANTAKADQALDICGILNCEAYILPALANSPFKCLRGFGAPPGGTANIPLTNNAKADQALGICGNFRCEGYILPARAIQDMSRRSCRNWTREPGYGRQNIFKIDGGK